MPWDLAEGVEVVVVARGTGTYGTARPESPYKSSSASAGATEGSGSGVFACGVDGCAGLDPGMGFAPRTLRTALMNSV